jgi:hypothetical protein
MIFQESRKMRRQYSLPSGDGGTHFTVNLVRKNGAELGALLQFFTRKLSVATKSALTDYAPDSAFKAIFQPVALAPF